MSQYDVIIIGGGPGGYVAAIRAAQLGLKTACVEKRGALGGTCLNIGCIPSKALLDSSEHFLFARTKLAKHGVAVSDVKLNLDVMMQRKEAVVRGLTGGIAGLFKKHKIDWVQGHGRLKSATTVEVLDEKGAAARDITATRAIILATGSDVIELPMAKFDGKRIIGSTEALAMTQVPQHLVVVGGGVIGLELGSVWLRLGSKVTVIEGQDRLIPAMDAELGKEIQKILTKQGMEFKMSHKLMGAKNTGATVEVQMQTPDGKTETLAPDVVLVAVGRRPYTDNLGLDKAGVAAERGRVTINDHFQTNVKGIYAVGDIVRGPMLAHKAEDEGIAVAEIIAGKAGHVNYNVIPGVVYTWPEVASVGFTEEELKAKGTAYKVGKFPFLANGRAKAMDETEGFVKVLADARTDKVLGVHIIGPRASEMIAEPAGIMEFGGSAEDIARTCHAHPTLPETLKEAALAVAGRQLHL